MDSAEVGGVAPPGAREATTTTSTRAPSPIRSDCSTATFPSTARSPWWCRRPTLYAADCPNPPVRVEAAGGTASGAGGWDQRPDYPKMASIEAAVELWSKTDLTPADVDVAELYDGFTFLTLAWLEALGFCGTGESGPFIGDGTRIALDGNLPLNTYGGQLSAGRMHGYWVLHEACLQLRGEAGERQVDSPEVAAVAVGGGPIAGCILLTR